MNLVYHRLPCISESCLSQTAMHQWILFITDCHASVNLVYHRLPCISESCLSQTAMHQWVLFITDCHASVNLVYHSQHGRWRKQNLIVRSAQSEAEVTSNRRLCCTYTVEANYWQTQSIMLPLYESSATTTEHHIPQRHRRSLFVILHWLLACIEVASDNIAQWMPVLDI